jgi:predicted AAA+ superfamily ATPase
MIQIEKLKRYLSEFDVAKLPATTKRDVEVDLSLHKIIILAGIRRCGKTYELFNIMKQLLSSGISSKNIVYINFEDERLQNFQAMDFDLLLDTFRELYDPNPDEMIYLFLDEIQIVKDWDRPIRRLHESGMYKLFLTGSSSKLLSSEISTLMAGRNVTYVIFPFSFQEMIRARNLNMEGREFYKNIPTLKRCAKEYIEYGGFPEVLITLDLASKKRIIFSYYESIIFRDIVERYRIGDVGQLRVVLSYIMNSYSSNISVSNLYNFMKTINMEIGKNTISKFLEYAASVFFISLNYKYSRGFKIRTQSRKKVYLIDNGFSLIFKTSEDYGRLLENAVYVELLRRKERYQFLDVFYFQGKEETDFLVTLNNQVKEIIQVCFEINETNFKREINSIHEAIKTFGQVKSVIITMNETMINLDDKHIKIVPFYEWSLKQDFEMQ